MKPGIIKNRRFLILAFDSVLICASFALAWLLRFDLIQSRPNWERFFALLPVIVSVKLAVFYLFGIGRSWWRYASMSDLMRLLKANLTGSLFVVAFEFFAQGLDLIPRSVLLLDGVFCFLLMGGVRFSVRAYREGHISIAGLKHSGGERVLVVGAGQAGQMLVREIRANPQLKLRAVGFIDDDEAKKNSSIQGLPVLGDSDGLVKVVRDFSIDKVIIAIPSASGKDIRRIVEKCRDASVSCMTLPGLGHIIGGKVSVNELRDVALDDLLGREPISLDTAAINSYLSGKRILVTGAAGSIGSEICRQVARFAPESLIIFDSAESPLFHIDRELRAEFPNLKIEPRVADIRDVARTQRIFARHMPHVVFHAAAYKHVPMMEINPSEAINTNVRGTRLLANAAERFGVEKFVMISTDKAVNPTNVMGATKRAAEKYVQGLSKRSRTQFVTVRFGNVLGSAGSVVPIFKQQIAAGGPVTVTHPEVTRFFMTIPEASQLVLQAGAMGRGGEIFLLDMGESVKIVKLAEDLIRLSGYEPYEDIQIKFVGLRPGEKLYEELLLAGEGVLPTSHEKIRIAQSDDVDWEFVNGQIEELYQAGRQADPEVLIRLLKELVPEYRPDLAGAAQEETVAVQLPCPPPVCETLH